MVVMVSLCVVVEEGGAAFTWCVTAQQTTFGGGRAREWGGKSCFDFEGEEREGSQNRKTKKTGS
jgi:hypothetical protein